MFGDAAFAQAPFASLGGGGAVYNVVFSDDVTASSALQPYATFVTVSTNTATAAGNVNTINNTFNIAFAGASAASGSSANTAIFVPVVSATASPDDSVSAQGNFVASLSDNPAVTDDVEANGVFPAQHSDTAGVLQDEFSYFTILLSAVVETANATDARSGTAEFAAALNEQGTGVVAFTSMAAFAAAVQSAATSVGTSAAAADFLAEAYAQAYGSAQVSRTANVTADLTEDIAAAASWAVQAVFKGTVEEVADIADGITAQRYANVSPDGIQLLVEIGGELVWGVINDTQFPNWQNVNNSQLDSWVEVNSSQNPGWTGTPS